MPRRHARGIAPWWVAIALVIAPSVVLAPRVPAPGWASGTDSPDAESAAATHSFGVGISFGNVLSTYGSRRLGAAGAPRPSAGDRGLTAF